MRLSRIRIDGFGALQGMDLRFGPAMNLVVGPNEAGKSTLQEAIVTGLFGLQSAERTRGMAVDRAERWRPWQGGAFGVSLELELERRVRAVVTKRYVLEVQPASLIGMIRYT